MPRHRTQAIILSSSDYGDYDRIVTLCTRDFGKIAAIAKGAKRSMKRFGGTLEQGSSVDMSFFEKKGASLVRLEHCDILHPWRSIRANLEKYLVLCQMLELVKELLPDKEKNSEVFSLLLHMMTLLEELKAQDLQNLQPFLLTFEVKLLRLTGFRPNLEHCIICKIPLTLTLSPWGRGTKGEGLSIGFSLEKGGCVCARCRSHEQEIANEAISAMKSALALKLKDMPRFSPSPQGTQEARGLLRQFIEMRVGKKLKAQDVAQSLIA